MYPQPRLPVVHFIWGGSRVKVCGGPNKGMLGFFDTELGFCDTIHRFIDTDTDSDSTKPDT